MTSVMIEYGAPKAALSETQAQRLVDRACGLQGYRPRGSDVELQRGARSHSVCLIEPVDGHRAVSLYLARHDHQRADPWIMPPLFAQARHLTPLARAIIQRAFRIGRLDLALTYPKPTANAFVHVEAATSRMHWRVGTPHGSCQRVSPFMSF